MTPQNDKHGPSHQFDEGLKENVFLADLACVIGLSACDKNAFER
jgi:hypothetical protein